MLYSYLLAFHSLVRWIVLGAAFFAVWVAISGWLKSKPIGPALRRAGTIFVVSLDVQLLIGLILYFAVSPLTRMAFQNMAVAMKDHEMRFFTVEHTTYMLVAVILAHVGSVLLRKAKTDRAKYRVATLTYGLSLLLILGGIPWWRPLLRLG